MKRKELAKTFMIISNINKTVVSVARFNWIDPLSAGDAVKRIHTVFPQLKFDRN